MTKIIFLVLLASLLNSSGQILFKKASNLCGPTHLSGSQTYFNFFKKVFTVPWLWFGFALMALALLTWLLAISKGQLSFIYPLGSVYYVFIFILSRIFLGEKFSRMKFAGALLIGVGIILITRS